MRAHRLVLAFAFALVACTTKPPTMVDPPPPGVVKGFTASPAMVAKAGDLVTLSWETQDATSVMLEQIGKGQVEIDHAMPSGTVQVAVNAETTFLLTAIGEGGTDSALQHVTVSGGGGALLFQASPTTLEAGKPTTLLWNAPGASQVTIKDASGTALDLGGQKESGSIIVAPTSSTHYDLDADGRTARVDVIVLPAILAFTAAPSPMPGQPISVSWRTVGGTKVSITRAGASTPVHVETDAGRVANGTYSDDVGTCPSTGWSTTSSTSSRAPPTSPRTSPFASAAR
ncbi:MAG: hypothetical protein IPJ65_00545 [Archangiaceae bacterium]|nr:hypothetical protein [Archangiaceae bacterium]